MRTVLLLNCTTLPGFDPGLGSHSNSLVSHFPYLFHHLLLLLFHVLYAFCTPVFLLVYTTVSLPLFHLPSLCLKRFRSRWRWLKRGRTLWRPPDPQPSEPLISHAFFPPYSFFFSPDWLSSDLLFLSALSHQESHLPEPIFPSLGAHLQHECGKLPFHKLSLHRLRLSQHFHWPFIGNYAYKRLLMQIQLRWGRSSGGSFLFCFFNVYNDSCFIFKPSFISADASSEVRASVNPL